MFGAAKTIKIGLQKQGINRGPIMKKIIITSFMLCIALSAFAEINPYIAIRGGYEKTKEKIDIQGSGNETLFNEGIPNATIAIGSNLGDKFRTELAYTYKQFKKDIFDNRDSSGIPFTPTKEKVTQQTILANLFYYPLKELPINPFVGVGAGLGMINMDYASNESQFTYALYIGADYTFARHWTVEIMGTYNSILAPYSNADDIQNFGGNIGVRYSF